MQIKRAIAVTKIMVASCAVVLLVACGGDSGKDNTGGSSVDGSLLRLDQPLLRSVSAIDSARLLTQASFGVTHESLVEADAHSSRESWIDAQMALPATLQLPKVEAYGNSSLRPPRHYVWWETAVTAEDQLRQRVAFALSQIFVVSDLDYTLGNAQHGMVHYYDMLTTSAFGNFRELLEDITLHPVMGVYLSMVRNEKANEAENIRPDENYAREIMQLFTIGLYELNAGGTPVPVNNPKPAYTQSDIEEYARVFTGWNFADSPEWQSTNLTQYDKKTPMVPQEEHHDKGSKQLLGGLVAPAGLTAREDLELALDSLFNHPNVGPFIGKALIQRLVTSNPTEQYVARVASVFNDNGAGVRGDLGAVVKAILLDADARQAMASASAATSQNFGKLKEPLIKTTHILRALNATPGAKADSKLHLFSKTSDAADVLFGQAPLSSPSVFNFFSPDYRSSFSVAGDASKPLYAPELQILTESLVSVANNDLHSMLYTANNRSERESRAAMLNIDAPMQILRKGRDVYLEHLNMLFMAGGMSAQMEAILAETIDERVPVDSADAIGDAPNAASDNAAEDVSLVDQQLAVMDEAVIEAIVLDTLYLVMASPEFMVQR